MKICIILISFILLFISSETYAQITIDDIIDIQSGIDEGTVEYTVEPNFTVDSIPNVIDGNHLTMAGIQGSNSLSITFAFSDTVRFTKSRVYFWTAGLWSLEIANTEDDLNFATGSYQLLVNQQVHSAFSWDSLAFEKISAKYVRLTAENLQNDIIYLGEWQIVGTLTLTSLYLYPKPARLLPGTKLQLKLKALDESDNIHDYPLDEPIIYSSESNSIATVGEFGEISGVSTGTTRINASSYTGSISGSVGVSVENDFESINAARKVVKVALLLQNPVIDSVNNKRIHQVWNWGNPSGLVDTIQEDFLSASDGVVQFQIVETVDNDKIFTKLDDEFMTIDTLIYYCTPANNKLYGRNTPGTLQYMAEIEGRVKFDYNAMVDYYDFDTKRNNGVIDEIWVYTFPFGGMYESQLMGPGAFWYNSPPLDHPGLEKLLSVMGWNYERGVAEALHSFGHRAESAIRQVYGRWEVTNPEPNNWEIFTRIDKVIPNGAHIGNIHFPPNGQSDYDYDNTKYVFTYADNWKRYPILLDQKRQVNRSEWYYPGGDYHRGYMLWWLSHLPRYEGAYEGILNNWWHYIVEYEEAVDLANSINWVSINNLASGNHPTGFQLMQNYPNPFNPSTTISFYLPKSVKISLEIYDVTGRKICRLINNRLPAGEHQMDFRARDMASGVYFYQISTTGFKQTKKMLLIK